MEFKVLKPAAKRKILTQVQALGSSVYFKFPQSIVYKTKAHLVIPDTIISCPKPSTLPLIRTKRKVTMNFVINSEVYFMVTDLTADAKQVYFGLSSDVMLLARRKNSRLKMPEDFDASIIIKRVAGETTIIRASIKDLSSEGCRAAIAGATPVLTQGEVVEGTLRFPEKKPVDIQALIKYQKSHPRSREKQVFGLQFIGLSDFTATKLQALNLDLQREIFLRTLEQS